MTDELNFGARFVRTWQKLQRFMADLDPEELKRLESCDMAETIALLARQPELGGSPLLERPTDPPTPPELLAAAMVRERLSAIEPQTSASESFGALFLDAWRAQGGLLSSFRYAEIQDLKRADREGCLKILRPRTARLDRVRRGQLAATTPESLAKLLIGLRAPIDGGPGFVSPVHLFVLAALMQG